jgi:hypothetical protein
MGLKNTIKQLAAVIPPLRRLMAHRDALSAENIELRREIGILIDDLKAARARYRPAQKLHPELWVPPGHFYSPLPSVATVKVLEQEIFELPPGIRGVNLNEAGQLELLKRFAALYPECPFAPQAVAGSRYFFENPNFSYNDAIILYCMMRHARPRRIIEIGSGHSSCAILDVNETFFGGEIACTFIDPFPQLLRDLLKDSDAGRVRILGRKVQDVSVDVFLELEESDILFVDSSHVAKTGSDVNYLVFKILPLLRKGVYIHFHDVFYPFEYPPEWVYQGRAWNESYLLRAFLQYNRAFEIQFFNGFMLEQHRSLFETQMPLCLQRPGASLWLKKTVHDQELDRAAAARRPRTLPLPPAILDLTRPEHTFFLSDGWYEPELDHCWMAQQSSFQIAGPENAGGRLVIRATSPLDGSWLEASADGMPLGARPLGPSGGVAPEFMLPDVLIGRPSLTVHLGIDRYHTVAGDPRKLGLAVSRIEVR